jgi:hypothetical protein
MKMKIIIQLKISIERLRMTSCEVWLTRLSSLIECNGIDWQQSLHPPHTTQLEKKKVSKNWQEGRFSSFYSVVWLIFCSLDLLWRFRFSLVDNRRALTKFLLAVDWTVESEVVQAAELLEQWRKRSPIEVTDALKLLGRQVNYQTNLVRAYAIDTLASSPDEELSLYLLQLVQALKFENIQETGVNQAGSTAAPVSSLGSFLIGRATKNIQLANYLYW